MSEAHLVTGATGFVGSALVLELLRTTDARVLCLVRPHDDEQAAQARLEQVLQDVALAFDMPDVVPMIRPRCLAIPGDLCLERCGVVPDRVGPVNEVWHSAASLRFEEDFREQIYAQNVEGTRRALSLSRAIGARKFNYISTAYVAGSQGGLIRESLVAPDAPVNNVYESSKVQGEQLVANSRMDYRILRPSIVIGHSKTCAIINPSGMYSYVRRMMGLRKVLERRGELEHAAEMEVAGVPDAPLNLVPVDAVVSAAVAISRAGCKTKERVFHLTNSSPPSVGHVVSEINAMLGTTGPRAVPVPSGKSPYSEHLNRQMSFFASYMTSPKVFDRTNTDAVVGEAAANWPVEGEGLRRYLKWYLENNPR